MDKAKGILLIIGGMIGVEVILTVLMPVIRTIIGIGAVDVNSNPNIGNYFGVSAFYDYAPWLLYLIPVIIGGILLVIVLKRDNVS